MSENLLHPSREPHRPRERGSQVPQAVLWACAARSLSGTPLTLESLLHWREVAVRNLCLSKLMENIGVNKVEIWLNYIWSEGIFTVSDCPVDYISKRHRVKVVERELETKGPNGLLFSIHFKWNEYCVIRATQERAIWMGWTVRNIWSQSKTQKKIP